MPTTARERLEQKIAAQTDDMLCASVIQMYAAGHFAGLPDDERQARCLVRRTIAEELCRRHPKADALMDEWMEDETPEGLRFITEHTYGELVALAVTLAVEPAETPC